MNKSSFNCSTDVTGSELEKKPHLIHYITVPCFKGGSDADLVFIRIHSDKLYKDLHPMLLLAEGCTISEP